MKEKDKKEKINKKKKLKISEEVKRRKIVKMIICLLVLIIVIEAIAMYVMHISKENKITYMDTYNRIENVNNEYYLAVGSSNFKYSHYNDSFIYEYEDDPARSR